MARNINCVHVWVPGCCTHRELDMVAFNDREILTMLHIHILHFRRLQLFKEEPLQEYKWFNVMSQAMGRFPFPGVYIHSRDPFSRASEMNIEAPVSSTSRSSLHLQEDYRHGQVCWQVSMTILRKEVTWAQPHSWACSPWPFQGSDRVWAGLKTQSPLSVCISGPQRVNRG